jgi:TolB-like protein
VSLPPVATPDPHAPAAAVAVLPFTNMSGDPDNEYFSDGITDDIITALTQVKGFVSRRALGFRVQEEERRSRDDRPHPRRHVRVAGSVRRAGNRVRVSVQLMNARMASSSGASGSIATSTTSSRFKTRLRAASSSSYK